jgi:hypothetical protein
MDVHAATHRWLSPSLFALVALCFFLPFATVSCDDASTSFTGVQLVTHTVPKGGLVHEGADCSSDISVCVERDGATTATVVLAIALLGVLLGLLGIARGPGWAAAVGAIALIKLQFAGGFIFGPDIYTHSGYQLALLLFAFAGCLHIRRAYRRKRPRSQPQGPLSVHLNALFVYGLMALGCSILAGGPPGLPRTIGSAALVWLGLAVAPAWILAAVVLSRWQKDGRPDLVERAARWDALLLLGPLLTATLVPGTHLRAFLLPPPSPSHADPRKELSCARSSFS